MRETTLDHQESTRPTFTPRAVLAATAAATLALLLGAAPSFATVHVPPLDCGQGCTAPTVDGQVSALEYLGGAKVPMQDYGLGGANGEMYLSVVDDRLHLGMRLPVAAGDMSGILTLYLDALRMETLTAQPGSWLPRGEDRRVTLRYSRVGRGMLNHTLLQARALGSTWQTMTSMHLYTAGWAISSAMSVPGNLDPGFLHVELSIQMRPRFGSESEPLASGLIGLGMLHEGEDGSWQDLPNGINTAPASWSTPTWETLVFDVGHTIPLAMATYNIGQTPDSWPVGDGGSGEPEDFADLMWDKDVVCVNEVWSSGDRQRLLDAVNQVRADNSLTPMFAAGMSWDDAEIDDTGLLLLSARPFAEPPELLEYDPDQCCGWDCWVDKGAIWGRVLFEGGAPGEIEDVLAGNADHFVDVFCTHLQAGGDSDEADVRDHQLHELRDFIDAHRAPDRPAFVLGDLNIHGGSADGVPPPQEYHEMIYTLTSGLSTDFDSAAPWLNGVYDLGMVSPPPSGTNIHDGECSPEIFSEIADTNRYDYIIQIPSPQQWPDWGVADKPWVKVDPVYVPSIDPEECLSDHAMLMTNVELIRTVEPGHWNPVKDHLVTYDIKTLIDHDPSGCCADWYTPLIRIGGISDSFSDDETPDGDVVFPPWKVATSLGGLQQVDMTVEVWEWDAPPGGDDHYDCTLDGLDPKFVLHHTTGVLWQASDAWVQVDEVAGFDLMPDGMFFASMGNGTENYGDVVQRLTAVELP